MCVCLCVLHLSSHKYSLAPAHALSLSLYVGREGWVRRVSYLFISLGMKVVP